MALELELLLLLLSYDIVYNSWCIYARARAFEKNKRGLESETRRPRTIRTSFTAAYVYVGVRAEGYDIIVSECV